MQGQCCLDSGENISSDALQEKDKERDAICREKDATLASKDEIIKEMTEKYRDQFNANYDTLAAQEFHIESLLLKMQTSRPLSPPSAGDPQRLNKKEFIPPSA